MPQNEPELAITQYYEAIIQKNSPQIMALISQHSLMLCGISFADYESSWEKHFTEAGYQLLEYNIVDRRVLNHDTVLIHSRTKSKFHENEPTIVDDWVACYLEDEKWKVNAMNMVDALQLNNTPKVYNNVVVQFSWIVRYIDKLIIYLSLTNNNNEVVIWGGENKQIADFTFGDHQAQQIGELQVQPGQTFENVFIQLEGWYEAFPQNVSLINWKTANQNNHQLDGREWKYFLDIATNIDFVDGHQVKNASVIGKNNVQNNFSDQDQTTKKTSRKSPYIIAFLAVIAACPISYCLIFIGTTFFPSIVSIEALTTLNRIYIPVAYAIGLVVFFRARGHFPSLSRLLTLLLVPIFGYVIIYSYIVKVNYDKGLQAYAEMDCSLSESSLRRVVYGWQLIDFGNYRKLAQPYLKECTLFQKGIDNQQRGNYDIALLAFLDILTSNYPNSVLIDPSHERAALVIEEAEVSEIAAIGTCTRISDLIVTELISSSSDLLPSLYFTCSEIFVSNEKLHDSYEMLVTFLTKYPDHTLYQEAETALLNNSAACSEIDTINKTLDNQSNFMPSLYYNCGEMYENNFDLSNAIQMYQNIIDNYPNHTKASEAQNSLALILISQAETSGAGIIEQFPQTGNTNDNSSLVIFQNDSPERLRIVFSGSESIIEELPACPSCRNFFSDPGSCPTKGPIGRYNLRPGQYTILVEAIGDFGIIPFTGNWNLREGSEYSSCFYLVIE